MNFLINFAGFQILFVATLNFFEKTIFEALEVKGTSRENFEAATLKFFRQL